jgi:DsbC/DsbD-like thiol-disulfide interchange protein
MSALFPPQPAIGAVAAVCLLFAMSSGPLRAQDASRWDTDAHATVRLIAGSTQEKGGASLRRAGIEIRLERGWKTYWRYPGDSGVPPKFDFAGSDNVKAATVLWPAPQRFTDDGGQSIGYTGAVILPVHVTPQDARKPVVLRLKLDYAICEKLCIPAQAKAELALAGKAGAHEAALAAAEARVPRPTMLGEGSGLVIRSVRRAPGVKPQVVVEIAAPGHADVDLFAEGPTAEWALPLPAPLAGRSDATRRFAFELVGFPPGAKAEGALLTLTAVAGTEAIEVSIRLD